ncbi:hypothetical protein TNCT_383331 [Trichonephila clavata]|uniref:Uncharacterized protein n=1 Tax=Trichonephila clavata TaxID=2740835 RepID=A0A8X6F567_TRICU|nr:hypothetical protein TNCT_383331 [Trichonephila clavata]
MVLKTRKAVKSVIRMDEMAVIAVTRITMKNTGFRPILKRRKYADPVLNLLYTGKYSSKTEFLTKVMRNGPSTKTKEWTSSHAYSRLRCCICFVFHSSEDMRSESKAINKERHELISLKT